MRILFDSMIFDKLIADSEVVQKMRTSSHRFLVAPLQYDQWNRMRDEAKRERIKALALELTLTVPETLATAGDGSKHAEDNLLARTAQAHADLLVTDDRKLLDHCEREGIRAQNYEAFSRELTGLSPEAEDVLAEVGRFVSRSTGSVKQTDSR